MLMSLGASPAQADTDHVTALHYFAAHSADLLEILISSDRSAAQRAVSYLSISGNQYSPVAKDAMKTAIMHEDTAGINLLLELGARPEIDYSTYITSYKSKWDLLGDAAHNQKQFLHTFQQPILTVVYCELPSIVETLLDAGADINTLSPNAYRTIERGNGTSEDVHSLLDAVRKRIAELSVFIQTGSDKNNIQHSFGETQVSAPIPLESDLVYLRDLSADSYILWTTTKQLQEAKVNYEANVKRYEDSLASRKESEGALEKTNAVKTLLSEFEALEAQLVKREAKTFAQLHPKAKLQEQPHYGYGRYTPREPKPWGPSITFQLPDLTKERRVSYIALFQACWDGDMATIKELTLAVWGNNQSESPLQIAVQDSSNFSPFSIAVLRKHFDIARAVLEIAYAQYAPTEKIGQAKHTLRPKDDDDDSTDGHGADFHIYSEIVDDRFTVENIGAVQSQVKSDVRPLIMLSWSCPVSRFLEHDDLSQTTSDLSSWARGSTSQSWYRSQSTGGRAPRRIFRDAVNGRTYRAQSTPPPEYIPEVTKPRNIFQLAIFLDDPDLLHFMIGLGEDLTVRKASGSTDSEVKSTFFRFAEQDLQFAIAHGRVQLIEEIIKRTGAGMPLDHLLKKSGIVVAEKPKYYQGLSVHGRKRADWANAGRDTQCELSQEQHPPLLHAARLASLESVDWFLSDAAGRCYTQFVDDHHDDTRIQNLAKAKGGLQASITNWLGLRSHLLIHCVILGKPTETALRLLRHVCKSSPDSLNHKSATGFTPLQLAFSLHRVEMIKVLIEAGADQTCRTHAGDNIIHSILSGASTSSEDSLPRTRNLFSLIDPRLLPSLFQERTTTVPGAATPLARWLYATNQPTPYDEVTTGDPEKLLETILEFSKGEDLDLINGEGDTPVHAAVRYNRDALLRTMLTCRSELLFRENATGRTPFEVAEDAYLSKEVFNDPPSLTPSMVSKYGRNPHWYAYGKSYANDILTREPESFLQAANKDTQIPVQKVWQVCKEFAATTTGTKRKLVKLVEANEVAKRLVGRKKMRSEAHEANDDPSEQHVNEIIKGDEVEAWLDMARWD